jgi:hypothetical protein
MRVKYADPSLPIRDPVTLQYPHLDGNGEAREVFTVPDTTFWHRRRMDKSIVEVADDADAAPTPTGREPVAPLTTRTR